MKVEYIVRNNLKRIRKKWHLTQEKMAELCCMSERGYRMIENCELSTTLHSLNKLAEGTGYTAAELLTENLVVGSQPYNNKK